MKKSLATAAAASLMALGVVGGTAGIAQADCAYTTCVTPTPTAKVPDFVQVGSKIPLKFKADAAGNTPVVGRVKFIVIGPKGFRVVKTKSYNGGTVQAKSSKIPSKGTYKVTIKFIAKPGTIFNGSKAKDTVTAR